MSEKRQRSAMVTLRMTPGERLLLRTRAEAAGMSDAAYVRHQALGEAGPRSVRRLPVDAVAVRHLVGRLGSVGNNLNQLTRLAHMGDLEAPGELAMVLDEVHQAADACMSALGYKP